MTNERDDKTPNRDHAENTKPGAELSDEQLEGVAGGYYTWRLSNVRVTSYSVSGSAG